MTEIGKPNLEIFADGFVNTEVVKDVKDAMYRPMGLAQGPDGSLYISESKKGKIWRVLFDGNKSDFGDKNLEKMKLRIHLPHIKTPEEFTDIVK